MPNFRTLDDVEVAAKRVLVRVDLNVPTKDGEVTDDTRIRAVLPTISEISDKGGKVILLAHFGRPKGEVKPEMSLQPIAAAVATRLGKPVAFAADCIGQVAADAVGAMADGDVLLLENTRFHKGEEKNDPDFVAALAANGDLYVNDAFATAHRAHASTEGLAHHVTAAAGRCMQKELEALDAALGTPKRPVAAIVGGAKVSSKIDLLENLVYPRRHAGDRRRHGQHVPGRQGRQCREIALRARSCRHGQPDHGGSRKSRLRCPAAGRPRHRQGVRDPRAQRCRRARRRGGRRHDPRCRSGHRRQGARCHRRLQHGGLERARSARSKRRPSTARR